MIHTGFKRRGADTGPSIRSDVNGEIEASRGHQLCLQTQTLKPQGGSVRSYSKINLRIHETIRSENERNGTNDRRHPSTEVETDLMSSSLGSVVNQIDRLMLRRSGELSLVQICKVNKVARMVSKR